MTNDTQTSESQLGLLLNKVPEVTLWFWLIKVLSRFHRREEAPPPAPPKSEVLLEEIRDLLAEKQR